MNIEAIEQQIEQKKAIQMDFQPFNTVTVEMPKHESCSNRTCLSSDQVIPEGLTR